MTNAFTVSIDEATGNSMFLVNDLSKGLVDETSKVRRASHVEPYYIVPRLFFHAFRKVFGEDGRVGDWTREWNCYWRVNLTPVGGPIIGMRFECRHRTLAIAYEIIWLEKNFL